jgi:hypothetical protein
MKERTMPRRQPPPNELRHKPSPRAAQARHIVGRTAQRMPGQGNETAPTTDWLAEREQDIAPGNAQADGVPVGSGKEQDAGRRQAVESRRGSHK